MIVGTMIVGTILQRRPKFVRCALKYDRNHVNSALVVRLVFAIHVRFDSRGVHFVAVRWTISLSTEQYVVVVTMCRRSKHLVGMVQRRVGLGSTPKGEIPC